MLSALQKLMEGTMQSRDLRLRFFAFIALGLFAAYVGFFYFSAKESVDLIKDVGYYFMLVALLVAVVETVLLARANWGELLPWLKQHFSWPFVCLLVVLSLYMWTIQDVGFKIIMDEINLLGTSMWMHYDNTVSCVMRGYELNGSFLPISGYVDKRPLFYPFLVSIVHDVTGYRAENAFYLNMALIPVTLTLTYVLGVLLSNIRGGLLAMLLLACFPMFNQCAHGGGFEALNFLMVLLVFLAGYLYLRRPGPATLSVLCMAFVLLANVRYESVMFFLPVAFIILIGWVRAGHLILSRGLFATPLLLLPVPWLHRIFELKPNTWQLGSKSADAPFGIEYLFRNLGQATSMFFGFNHDQPVSVFLSFFGLIGCLLFLVVLLRQARKPEPMRPDYLSLSFISLGVVCLLLLLLLYFWDFDDMVTRRLALPILFLLIFPGIAAIGQLSRSSYTFPVISVLAVFALFLEVSPRYAKDVFTNEYTPAQIANWKSDFANARSDEYNLVIDVPGVWVTHKTPAILREVALKRKELLKFHLTNKTFDNIFLVERFTKDFADGVLRGGKNERLDDDFVLEHVVDETFNGVVFIRISRVTDITVEEPEWIRSQFKKIDTADYSREELLEYQHEQKRRLASLLP